MPVRQALSTIQINALSGGLNTRDNKTEVADNEVTDCMNVELDDKEIRKRKGVTEHRTEAGTDDLVGLFEHYDQTNRQLLKTHGQAMKYDDGASWSSISLPITLTDNLKMNFITYAGVTYCLNGTDSVLAWDGSSMTEKASLPKGRFAIIFQNRVYMAGFTSATDSSTIKASDLDDAETYSAESVLKVDPRNGQEITGLGVLPGGIVVFKSNSIYYYTGGFDSASSVTKIAEGVGCVNHNTIAYDGQGGLIFLGYDGVYRLTGTTLIRISEKIQPTVEGINWAQVAKATAIFYDGQYRLSVPNSNATENDLELLYTTRFNSWVKNDGYIVAARYAVGMLSDEETLFIGSPTTSEVYYKDDSVDNDASNAIDAYVESKVYTFKRPEQKRKLKKLFVLLEKSGNWNLTVGYKLDDAVDFTTQTINLASESALLYNNGETYNSGITYGRGAGTKGKFLRISKPKFRILQMKLANANADEPFTVKEMSAIFRQFSQFK